MNARRFTRTMQEAFGPYTDHRLLPMRETDTERAAGVWLAVVVFIVVAGAICWSALS